MMLSSVRPNCTLKKVGCLEVVKIVTVSTDTITYSKTERVTAASTVTPLKTTTLTAPTYTSTIYSAYYPGCQSDNALYGINMSAVEGISNSTGLTMSTIDVSQSTDYQYDCCVACWNAENCVGSDVYPIICQIWTSRTYDPSAQAISFYSQYPGPFGFIVSNGNCGQFSYSGPGPYGK
jgi:hypothetical protein